jgi:DNA-binding MarR family transcriptional regulator
MRPDMTARSNDNHDAGAAALAQELSAVLGKLKRRLREQAHVGELTPSQRSALLRLEREGPATASNLARAEGMRPQSMGAVVAALESAGLVSGATDASDGRRTILSITDACRKWIQDGRSARRDWLSRTLQERLSPQQRDELAAAVELLRRLVDD